jgi:DNA invertase Pin-like site-specific DNA recombinase
MVQFVLNCREVFTGSRQVARTGAREFDVVAAWSVDRLGRSLQNLVVFLNNLHSRPPLYLHKQGIDTTTPGGTLLFQMLGVFAEFE